MPSSARNSLHEVKPLCVRHVLLRVARQRDAALARRRSRSARAPRAARSPAPRRSRRGGSAAARCRARAADRRAAATRAAAARRPRARAPPPPRARPRARRRAPRCGAGTTRRARSISPRAEGARRARLAAARAAASARVRTLAQSSSACCGVRGPGMLGDVTLERVGEARVEHQPLHARRARRRAARPAAREVALALLVRPVAEGRDAHARDAERGQHVAHVLAQRRREHHEERALGVDARIVVGEVGDAVQRDGGLARAGAAADRDEAARPRDQLELRRVDQAGDLGQPLVGAAARAREVGAEPARGAARPARGRAAPSPRRRRAAAACACTRCQSAARRRATKTPSGASTRSSAPSRIRTVRRAATVPLRVRPPNSSSYSSPCW